MRMTEFVDNAEFKEEFLPKYESVINTAGMYMNENSALSNVKQAAELLISNHNFNQMASQTELCEDNLRIIYSIIIPDDEQKSQMATDLNRLCENIEKSYYSKTYSSVIKQISNLSSTDEGFKEKEKIEADYGKTSCKTCKKELSSAISGYNTKYQNAQLNILIRRNEEISQQASSQVFNSIEKRKCIDKFMAAKSDSLASYKDLLTIETNKIDALIKETVETLKTDITAMNAEQLKEHNNLLDAYIKRLETGLANFCKNVKGICDCKLD
jgi:hypothetical protein